MKHYYEAEHQIETYKQMDRLKWERNIWEFLFFYFFNLGDMKREK